jgi:hypothetical protein
MVKTRKRDTESLCGLMEDVIEGNGIMDVRMEKDHT